uniref:Transmembrane protein 8B n=1 Tax=Callorhinchus milii TaxID=7868 RepID=A0A4W3HZL0_CALMI
RAPPSGVRSSASLNPFTSFASVELFHFHVPEDTVVAVWNLITFKEQGGNFGDTCPDRDITVYYRAGAPPVINPLHTRFPQDTVIPSSFTVTLTWTLPNRTTGVFNVSSPLPGDWFLAAHLPKDEGKISVKARVHSSSQASVLTPIPCSFPIPSNSLLTRVFVPSYTSAVTVQLIGCRSRNRTVGACPISLKIRARAPPLHNSSHADCSALPTCQLHHSPPHWGRLSHSPVSLTLLCLARSPLSRSLSCLTHSPLSHSLSSVSLPLLYLSHSPVSLTLLCLAHSPLSRSLSSISLTLLSHSLSSVSLTPLSRSLSCLTHSPLSRSLSSVSHSAQSLSLSLSRSLCPRFEECSNVSAEVKVRSFLTPCINECGAYGQCKLLRGCVCVCARWRGRCVWGGGVAMCLLATLLLCLSNLMFVPPVAIAVRSQYLLEASVYTFTMFFSTFYHACDQPGVVVLCIMDYDVLQFCDFLGSMMSVWVTVIAMARLQPIIKQILYLLGAMLLSMALQLDRHGLWNLLGPSLFALGIMAIAWTIRTIRRRRCYPPTWKRWVFYLFPGTVIAMSAVALYTFVETEENYFYIHSIWHMLIAGSVGFLLPPRPRPGCGYQLCQTLDFLLLHWTV